MTFRAWYSVLVGLRSNFFRQNYFFIYAASYICCYISAKIIRRGQKTALKWPTFWRFFLHSTTQVVWRETKTLSLRLFSANRPSFTQRPRPLKAVFCANFRENLYLHRFCKVWVQISCFYVNYRPRNGDFLNSQIASELDESGASKMADHFDLWLILKGHQPRIYDTKIFDLRPPW